MRKLLILLILLFNLPIFASTTAVTATITGQDGNFWANGTYRIEFRPTPNNPTPAANYTVNGVSFTQLFSGNLDANGSLSVTLTDNSTISPALSQWIFTVCPNATFQCYTVIQSITGGSVDLSTTLSNATPSILVNATPLTKAYADSEVNTPAGNGSIYYNVKTLDLELFNNGGFVPLLGNVKLATMASGTDVCAQINNTAALGSPGTTILLPAFVKHCTTQINFDGKTLITLKGSGGQTAGATASTSIIWDGTGTAVSVKSSTSIIIEAIQFLWSSASFVGPFLDAGHSGLNTDTSWFELKRCSFFKTGSGATNQTILRLDKVINSTIHYNTFQNYDIAISGMDDSTSYMNAVKIDHNNFSSSTGTAITAHIRNPGQATSITTNTFEMGTAAGTPQIVNFTNTPGQAQCLGCFFTGNWIGDAGTGSWTELSVFGGGWYIAGNYIGGTVTTTAIGIGNGTSGVTITGNQFDHQSIAVSLGTSISGFRYDANHFGSVTTDLSGTPTGGCWEVGFGLTCTSLTPGAGITVVNLPSAATFPGAMIYVTDSTAIASEGQTCVGSGAVKALAFSNGSVWKCF